MKKLSFVYRMSLRFSEPVWDHYFALRCIPVDHEHQKITITSRYVQPTDSLDEVMDGFGNRKYVGHYNNPHRKFEYEVEGIALVDGMKVQKETLHPMYKYPSAYTVAGPGVRAFAEQIGIHEGSNLEKALQVMQYLYRHFTYKSGVTDIYTTAETAVGLGCGVCQDYAHIMIAVLRYLGVPARYVNGLMIGEGYTHAWVEVYTGEGWYGLDPTNHLHVDDYYIKLAHGRDYKDCVLDKGRFLGRAEQTQEIYVNVEEIT
ncbi:MAG: transglutaminase domain-containing protein [Dorea sp.]